MADYIYDEIDINDSNSIMMFGAGVQRNIAELSQRVLKLSNENEKNVIKEDIFQAVKSLNNLENEMTKKITFMNQEAHNKVFNNLRLDALKQVESMEEQLDSHRVELMMNCSLYDKLLQMNNEYGTQLEHMMQYAREKIQEINSMKINFFSDNGWKASLVNHIEHKIRELETTRNISMQQSAQILLLQKNANLLAGALQSTIYNIIPLWKSQMINGFNYNYAGEANEEIHDSNRLLIDKLCELYRFH